MESLSAVASQAPGRPNGKPCLPKPADLVAGLLPHLLEETACTLWVLTVMHPSSPRCPWCGQPFTNGPQLASWFALRRLRCHHCNRMCTGLTGTPLHKTGLSPRDYVLLCLLVLAGEKDSAIAQRLHMHPETVRRWRKRWQEAS